MKLYKRLATKYATKLATFTTGKITPYAGIFLRDFIMKLTVELGECFTEIIIDILGTRVKALHEGLQAKQRKVASLEEDLEEKLAAATEPSNDGHPDGGDADGGSLHHSEIDDDDANDAHENDQAVRSEHPRFSEIHVDRNQQEECGELTQTQDQQTHEGSEVPGTQVPYPDYSFQANPMSGHNLQGSPLPSETQQSTQEENSPDLLDSVNM